MNDMFAGSNGNKLVRDEACEFSSNFDWVITRTKIIKKKDIPKTVYCKTDFLPSFCDVLCSIENNFTLITGGSDYSPQVNFKSYFDKIISNPFVDKWFMENKSYDHPKVKSSPVGLGAKFEDKYMDIKFLNAINKSPEIKKNIVFCSWNNRTMNDCGQENCIRPRVREIIKQNTMFQWYDPTLPFQEFIDILSQHKYALCPIGNGLDPAPTCWFCLGLGVIPIIWSTPNSRDLYSDVEDHVIFFEDPQSLVNIKLQDKQPLSDISFLTSQYWLDKII